MSEDKKRSGKKISAWIPQEMYDTLVSVGYNSPTEAIMKGLDLLLKESIGVQIGADGVQDGTQSDKREFSEDSADTRELRARVEELQDHTATLKKELDKAAQDKETLQNMYNNYFLQVQTLINQKAIEAPGAKKPWYKFW
jgi:predicted RNase H-like nuclease (RuvC/YqgF family)